MSMSDRGRRVGGDGDLERARLARADPGVAEQPGELGG